MSIFKRNNDAEIEKLKEDVKELRRKVDGWYDVEMTIKNSVYVYLKNDKEIIRDIVKELNSFQIKK